MIVLEVMSATYSFEKRTNGSKANRNRNTKKMLEQDGEKNLKVKIGSEF